MKTVRILAVEKAQTAGTIKESLGRSTRSGTAGDQGRPQGPPGLGIALEQNLDQAGSLVDAKRRGHGQRVGHFQVGHCSALHAGLVEKACQSIQQDFALFDIQASPHQAALSSMPQLFFSNTRSAR